MPWRFLYKVNHPTSFKIPDVAQQVNIESTWALGRAFDCSGITQLFQSRGERHRNRVVAGSIPAVRKRVSFCHLRQLDERVFSIYRLFRLSFVMRLLRHVLVKFLGAWNFLQLKILNVLSNPLYWYYSEKRVKLQLSISRPLSYALRAAGSCLVPQYSLNIRFLLKRTLSWQRGSLHSRRSFSRICCIVPFTLLHGQFFNYYTAIKRDLNIVRWIVEHSSRHGFGTRHYY